MNSFRVAHASGENWGLCAKACVTQLGPAGGANLGFVYATDHFAGDLSSILTFLRETTGVEHWVGTVGLGIVVTGKEYFDEPALAVMIGSLPDRMFRVFPSITRDLEQFRADNASWLEVAQPAFGVVHADPRNPRMPDLLSSFAAETATFLVGGLTSSRTGFEQIADKVVDGGISGVLFSAEVGVATGLTQGCSPIGAVHQVTSGEENVIFELDGRPALDVLMADAGETSLQNLARAARRLHAAIPVEGSDTGDYLVRNLVGIDPERSWVAIGDRISVGDRVTFCRRDGEAAREDIDRMLKRLKGRINDRPKAGVYYTCVARGRNLFDPDSEELRRIKEAFGDVPIVGFFCNGEISHNRLYGYTGVLALFL
jgi:small ligand-binding sensory domain FIST